MNEKTIFITGASSGIGYAAALACCQRGWQVVATARTVERLVPLQQAVNALAAPHGELLPLAADVTNVQAMREAAQQAVEHFGGLDVVIANAGLGFRGDLVAGEWVDLDTVLRTNMDGVLHTIRATVPNIRTGGQVIFISSVAGQIPLPYATIYGATKAFVSSLARSLRLEWEDRHIAVTDMLVGRTDTAFNANRKGEGSRTSGKLPSMTAEDVAAALIKAIEHQPKTMVLRFFDRLILWGNALFPALIGYIAKRQYR